MINTSLLYFEMAVFVKMLFYFVAEIELSEKLFIAIEKWLLFHQIISCHCLFWYIFTKDVKLLLKSC